MNIPKDKLDITTIIMLTIITGKISVCHTLGKVHYLYVLLQLIPTIVQ